MTRLSRFFTRYGLRRDPMNRAVEDVIYRGKLGCGITWQSNHGPVECLFHHHDRHWWVGVGESPHCPAWSFVAFGSEHAVGARKGTP